ncbi:DUF389 domain-containing protein [Candidatus Woesebacteria bacterium]|nr:DUF389 domain-containing protein [Candidatus Woesebacteria bacterium]
MTNIITTTVTKLLRLLSSVGLHFVNDVKDVDEAMVLEKIESNNQLSFSFIVLLVVSSVVSTLGLLLNAPAIIIGGMIISPLMWPLMKISIGLSFERKSFIKQAITLLSLSIVISVAASFLIASVSPIKHLNNEILTRTTPTTLDIFVALAAGLIAAMAIVQKRISDSLAGVAVATSLMPPLCVAGIGLSFYSLPTFAGGFMLFMANVVSILLSSILTFIFVGVKRDRGTKIRSKGLVTIAVALLITSIPLAVTLKNYTFKLNAYDKTQQILTDEFKKISPSIVVQNVTTDSESGSETGTMIIEAELLIPEGTTISYQQKADIVARLEHSLSTKIDLNLRVQQTINLISEKDATVSKKKQLLTELAREEIGRAYSGAGIDTIDMSYNQADQQWTVGLVLRGDPSILFTESSRSDIEKKLSLTINEPVHLNIDIIPRLKLKSQPDLENDQITKDIHTLVDAVSPDIDILAINLTRSSSLAKEDVSATSAVLHTVVDLRVPESLDPQVLSANAIQEELEKRYKRVFDVTINIVEKKTLKGIESE